MVFVSTALDEGHMMVWGNVLENINKLLFDFFCDDSPPVFDGENEVIIKLEC